MVTECSSMEKVRVAKSYSHYYAGTITVLSLFKAHCRLLHNPLYKKKLELISPVPHDSIQTVILVSRGVLLRVVPLLVKGG